MELTSSFPPADALLTALRETDYRKHYNRFQDAVEVTLLVVAAVVAALYTRAAAWWGNGAGDRVKGAAETAYLWLRVVAVPEAVALYADLRGAYETVSRR
jgi:hypothetical protein